MKLLARNSADALRAALQNAQNKRRGAAPVILPQRRRGLGDYGTAYSEDETFRAIENPGQLQLDTAGAPVADPWFNPIAFNSYPFSTNNASGNAGSVTMLSLNQRRQLLLIQNISTAADLYVNFGTDAALGIGLFLTPGAGVIFDDVCPNNAVSVYFDSATNEPGIIIEGAPNS